MYHEVFNLSKLRTTYLFVTYISVNICLQNLQRVEIKMEGKISEEDSLDHTEDLAKQHHIKDQFVKLNHECHAYAKKTFKDIDKTAYRVPDVLFPRDGQSGDYLTMDDVRLGLHSKFADDKHKVISIRKLLEERRGTSAVEKIAQRLYNWGTSHGEGIFIICNYPFQNYLTKFNTENAVGDHDIIAIGEFGFVFIQVKAATVKDKNTNLTQISQDPKYNAGENDSAASNVYGDSDTTSQATNQKLFWQENVNKAVLQLIKDKRVFLEMNKDLEFVKYAPFHFIVGVPEIRNSHVATVDEYIQKTLSEENETMRVIALTQQDLSTQVRFNQWFKNWVLLNCVTKRYFCTDNIYTLVGRYTNPDYSKLSRLSTPGAGTKRASTLISFLHFTQRQEEILSKNRRRQVIAGGYGTGKTFVLVEEAVNLVLGHTGIGHMEESKKTKENWKKKDGNIDNQMESKEKDSLADGRDANSSCIPRRLEDGDENDGSTVADLENHDNVNGNLKNFVFLISCSNVGENGFVFNDPDLLIEQIEIHLQKRLVKRIPKKSSQHPQKVKQKVNKVDESSRDGLKGRNNIEIWKIDEAIKAALPNQKSSHSNIACEAFTVDVLLQVIRYLVQSKAGYRCHVLLDEFPAFDLVHEFQWEKLQPLHTEFPDMRLWVTLSAEGNMQTLLSCEDLGQIRDDLKVPQDIHLGLLEESKRMSKSVFNLMVQTQKYEGKTEREHFRCGIEISEYTPMWLPMTSCTCYNIAKGFFECTCMTSRLVVCLKEIWKRISRMGNHEVYILIHVIMFKELREKLVKMWTEGLRSIGVSCNVNLPNLENYSYTVPAEDATLPKATIIHNRYFHGCEGKVMIIFPPLGGPQFEPMESNGLSLAIPFDSVIARSMARLFIVTPTEEGMIQYSEELCKYIQCEKNKEQREGSGDQQTAKRAKWDRFLSIFKFRKSLPSYLSKMVSEDVLVKCVTDRLATTNFVTSDCDGGAVIAKNAPEAPITKWYMAS